MRALRARRLVLLAATLSMTAATLTVTATAPAQAGYSGDPMIAWIHWAGGSNSELWAARVNLAGKHRVYRSSAFHVSAPSVSKDAQKIAFVAWNESRHFMSRIYVVNPSGFGVERWTLPSAPYNDTSPVWAPDRSALYFVRYNQSTGSSRIMRITSAGATPTAVPNTSGAGFPTVSPDGNYLAYTRDGSVIISKSTGADAFVLEAAPTSRDQFLAPQWSPDGRRLSVIHDNRDFSTSIQVMGTSAFELDSLVISYPYEVGVSDAPWSDDSTRLYYSINTPNSRGFEAANLRRISAEGGSSTALTSNDWTEPWDYLPSLGGGAGPAPDATAPEI